MLDLDGRPVLLLCSGNALGLADHPRVREAAADAAMRWGVGAGAARVASGTMTLHRRLAGAEAFAYDHGDPEHLAWGLRQADGRAALIATDGLFGLDGDLAPLEEIVSLARRFDVRVLVDEAHALGALGPGGRGAVAEAGLAGEIDVLTGSLGKGLGAYGGFACCDHVTARYLVNSARTLQHSTAPPPVAVAAAMAALALLEEEPRRVEKLLANAEAPRDELAREGLEVARAPTHILPL